MNVAPRYEVTDTLAFSPVLVMSVYVVVPEGVTVIVPDLVTNPTQRWSGSRPCLQTK